MNCLGQISGSTSPLNTRCHKRDAESADHRRGNRRPLLSASFKKDGVAADVFELDHTPMDRLQGYRLSLGATGNWALKNCLPDPLFRKRHDRARLSVFRIIACRDARATTPPPQTIPTTCAGSSRSPNSRKGSGTARGIGSIGCRLELDCTMPSDAVSYYKTSRAHYFLRCVSPPEKVPNRRRPARVVRSRGSYLRCSRNRSSSRSPCGHRSPDDDGIHVPARSLRTLALAAPE